ncbi:MAG: hypothetical protein AABM33_05995 [Pseudomonadota bacterium]
MTGPAILARVEAAGVRLRADSGRIVVAPREALTDELRALIRSNKPALLTALAPDPAPLPPLTPAERDRLIALAVVWQMDAEDIQTMFRQCDYGGEGAGTYFTAAGSRAFWFGQADEHVR